MLVPTFWAIAGILIIVLDLSTTNFIAPVGLGLIVFGAGEYFGVETYTNIVLSTAATLLTYYPFIKFVRGGNEKQATPDDEYIGRTGKVIEVIDDNEVRVEIGGEIFYALVDEPVKAGDRVKVQGIEGVKLIVKKA